MIKLNRRQVSVLSRIEAGAKVVAYTPKHGRQCFSSEADGLSACLYLTLTMRALRDKGVVLCADGYECAVTELGRRALRKIARAEKDLTATGLSLKHTAWVNDGLYLHESIFDLDDDSADKTQLLKVAAATLDGLAMFLRDRSATADNILAASEALEAWTAEGVRLFARLSQLGDGSALVNDMQDKIINGLGAQVYGDHDTSRD